MQPLYRGNILTVYDREGYDVVSVADACAILPLRVSTDGVEVLLVEQFRVAPDRRLWEIPAGRIDAGESPHQCAQRELAEETGYQASQWTALGGFYTAPGFSTEYLHVFLARDLNTLDDPVEGDEDDLRLRWWPLKAIESEDAKTLAALHLWSQWSER